MSDGEARRRRTASRLPILLAVVVVVLLEVGVVEPAAAVELVGLVAVVALAVGLLSRLWLRTVSAPRLPATGLGSSGLTREVGRLRLAIEDSARDRAGLVYTLGRHVAPLAEARLARAGVAGEDLDGRLRDPRALDVLGPTVHELVNAERPRGGDRRDPGWTLDRIERVVAELERERGAAWGTVEQEDRP